MSVEIKYALAIPSDAAMLTKNARSSDKNEMLAMGYDVEKAIATAISTSVGESWIFYINGEVAGAWGVVPCSILTGYAIPWLLTTSVVDKYKKTFFKESKRVVSILKLKYSKMYNLVDVRYTASLRWVEKLGFAIKPSKSTGRNGELFHEVIMEEKV